MEDLALVFSLSVDFVNALDPCEMNNGGCQDVCNSPADGKDYSCGCDDEFGRFILSSYPNFLQLVLPLMAVNANANLDSLVTVLLVKLRLLARFTTPSARLSSLSLNHWPMMLTKPPLCAVAILTTVAVICRATSSIENNTSTMPVTEG